MMSGRKAFSVEPSRLAAGAVLATLLAAPYAGAGTVRINFGGAAGSGYADLTLAPDPDASSSYDPNVSNATPTLSQWDPVGAQHITNASGSFNGSAIKGVLATNSGTPPPLPSPPGGFENLPKSFSWLTSSAGQNSYDNLFYLDGSPLVCPPGSPPYPFFGGFLDIFGVMFALDNGDVVGLWSDGVTVPDAFGPGWPGGLTFGLAVYTPAVGGGYDQASSQFAGASAAIPEPGILWLLGAALLGLFVSRRTGQKRGRWQRTG